MLSAITAALGAIPALISLFSSIWAFIQKEESMMAQKALADKVAAAVGTAAQTGNTSDLENIFKTGS